MINQYTSSLIYKHPVWFVVLLVWTLFWKGCALWISSKRNQGWWFTILLVLNTVGILEIVYIFFVAKKKWADIKAVFKKEPTMAN